MVHSTIAVLPFFGLMGLLHIELLSEQFDQSPGLLNTLLSFYITNHCDVFFFALWRYLVDAPLIAISCALLALGFGFISFVAFFRGFIILFLVTGVLAFFARGGFFDFVDFFTVFFLLYDCSRGNGELFIRAANRSMTFAIAFSTGEFIDHALEVAGCVFPGTESKSSNVITSCVLSLFDDFFFAPARFRPYPINVATISAGVRIGVISVNP